MARRSYDARFRYAAVRLARHAFAELDKLNKGSITARLKEIKNDTQSVEEAKLLSQYLQLLEQEAATKKAIQSAEMELDAKLLAFYPTLT